MTLDELLNDIYYKQHNYDGIEGLYKKEKAIYNKTTINYVKEWLGKQQNKQMTKAPVIGKKSFLPIYSETPYAFQIDLTFFPRYKKQNNNIYVLFTAININTRYVYAYYSKDKEMNTILNMLKQMEKKTVINKITCDEGTEFNNSMFKEFCSENKIELFFVKDDSHKLGIMNRFHRTLKDKLSNYFLVNDTVKWVDVIDKIIFNYNHTVNRGIGIEPAKVSDYLEHEIILWKRDMSDILYTKENNKFNIGDKVRILNKKVLFKDKMLPKYSSSVFNVEKVLRNSCLVSNNGKTIEVKNTQLLKIDNITNIKEIKEIPKILKEEKSRKKLERENLGDVVLDRPKREIKPNKKYL